MAGVPAEQLRMIFTTEQLDQIIDCVLLVEEIDYPSRKGVPQGKYVIEIPNDASYETFRTSWIADDEWQTCNVDDELKGVWIMSDETDLSYVPLKEALKEHGWVRAKSVTIQTWEAE